METADLMAAAATYIDLIVNKQHESKRISQMCKIAVYW